MDGRTMVTIKRACTMVGVSRRTIYNWMNAGKIEYVRTAGGSVRIYVDTLWRGPEKSVVSDPPMPDPIAQNVLD